MSRLGRGSSGVGKWSIFLLECLLHRMLDLIQNQCTVRREVVQTLQKLSSTQLLDWSTILIQVCFKFGPKLIGGTLKKSQLSSTIYKMHLKNGDRFNSNFQHNILYGTCSHVYFLHLDFWSHLFVDLVLFELDAQFAT